MKKAPQSAAAQKPTAQPALTPRHRPDDGLVRITIPTRAVPQEPALMRHITDSRFWKLLDHLATGKGESPVKNVKSCTALLRELDLVNQRGDLTAVGWTIYALLEEPIRRGVTSIEELS